MSLEELQKENEHLKKEIQTLKNNEYEYKKALRYIFNYCNDIEKSLKSIQSDMDYVYTVTRLDWSE